MSATVLAAGGVLWRPAAGGIEVALVHRPRYDDWSLPKGKAEPGEHLLTTALREVREETGQSCVAGRTLGSSSYRVFQDGRERDKTVRWWSLRATGGSVRDPDDEVDEVRWVDPAEAAGLVTAGRDTVPLELLRGGGTSTTTVLLVRHGRAGDRASWAGDDLDRPLDARGERQAAALAALLTAYGPVRVLSAPARRCQDTVLPLARACGLGVEVATAFGEQAYAADPDAALECLRELARGPGAVVVASQGGAVPWLVRAAGGPDRPSSAKGSVWALTFAGGRLLDADHLPPLA